jgi:hypothetical protein
LFCYDLKHVRSKRFPYSNKASSLFTEEESPSFSDSARVSKKRKRFDFDEIYNTATATIQESTVSDKNLKLDYLKRLRKSKMENIRRKERLQNDPDFKRREDERIARLRQKQVQHNIKMRSDSEYRKQWNERLQSKKEKRADRRQRREERLQTDPQLRQQVEEKRKAKLEVREFLAKERQDQKQKKKNENERSDNAPQRKTKITKKPAKENR